MTSPVARRVAVVGFGTTGEAVVRVLVRLGSEVVVVDDSPEGDSESRVRTLGAEVVVRPDRRQLAAALDGSDLVVVSPGVPPRHAVFELARPGQLVGEIELAAMLARMPIVAVTGTNGKTTVVELVAAMLNRSGIRAAATGNIGIPLIEVVTRGDLDVAVAEVSSFQLATTRTFRPAVATWLNFADNHLDWHGSRAEYLAAKEMIWKNQGPNDVAVANVDDPDVKAAARRAPSRVVWFGTSTGDYRLDGDRFIGPDGAVLATTSDLARDMPHDRSNALGALATAIEAGASATAVTAALRTTLPPRHRLELVASIDGVDYVDDSKATTPAAVEAALRGFPTAVVILGGRNKGLDLRAILAAAERPDTAGVRAVVAIGESADEIAAAFAPAYEVRVAASMDDAVRLAAALAHPKDVVLLSPGCASFDWYTSYEARGDDFRRVVEALGAGAAGQRREQ